LTAWIAGYGSDVAVRVIFGPSKKLREIFIRPSIKMKGIQPSWWDIKRNIKLPEKMNDNLAEETGVHIGDGNLYADKNQLTYRYSISGDLTNDYLYHKEYLNNLMKNLYNCNGFFVIRRDKNNIDSVYKSKAIFQFKHQILGLPVGNKRNIQIPKQIFGSESFEKRCIAGIIDTDFNLTSSMTITGKLHSLGLIKQISEILNKNKLKHKCTFYSDYGRFYIGTRETKEIIEDWKLKNIKHNSKYLIWKEFKKFLPFTTTAERLAALAGKLQIEELENISKKRSPGKDVSLANATR
jgi:hypothetical protein